MFYEKTAVSPIVEEHQQSDRPQSQNLRHGNPILKLSPINPLKPQVLCVISVRWLARRSQQSFMSDANQTKTDCYLFESIDLLDQRAFRCNKKSWLELSFKAYRMTVDLMVQVIWLTCKSKTYPIQFTIGFKL